MKKKPSGQLEDIPVAVLERMAATLRLLAHPHRLKIIELLEGGSGLPVHEIMERVGLPHAATSQHLNQMKRAGLVASRRNGREVHYLIADPRSITILNCIRKQQGVLPS